MARCCDVEAALERLGGDMELYKDLVDRFLDDTAGTRARIDAAIERADAKLLHTAAHSLKGLASSVGATAATAALADLEEIGLRQDLPAAAPAWRRFQAEMERTADELAPYHRRSFARSN